jgi:hypothetical protein
MTYGTDTFYDFAAPEPRFLPRSILPQNFFAGVALVSIALACAWILGVYLDLGGSATVVDVPAVTNTASKTASLFDSTSSMGFHAGTFVKTSSKGDRLQIASREAQVDPTQAQITQAPLPPPSPLAQNMALPQNVPLPMPRPSEIQIAQSRPPAAPEIAQIDNDTAQSTTSSEEPSIFQKFFGKSQPSGPTLAYATPDGGINSSGHALPYDRMTAVYDISAHVVYMPDGSKLEAHSGLGSLLDDPRYAHERMRGVTPPHVYDLTAREALFHGVQALRLNPVGGDGEVFGRSGLLAHSYMLGPKGDSNGCVSFKNYEAFLRAYMNHEVKRLVVVARLD